jgi:hypothetical protein
VQIKYDPKVFPRKKIEIFQFCKKLAIFCYCGVLLALVFAVVFAGAAYAMLESIDFNCFLFW